MPIEWFLGHFHENTIPTVQLSGTHRFNSNPKAQRSDMALLVNQDLCLTCACLMFVLSHSLSTSVVRHLERSVAWHRVEVADLCSLLCPRHRLPRQHFGVQEPQLHQHTCLIPIDALRGQLYSTCVGSASIESTQARLGHSPFSVPSLQRMLQEAHCDAADLCKLSLRVSTRWRPLSQGGRHLISLVWLKDMDHDPILWCNSYES